MRVQAQQDATNRCRIYYIRQSSTGQLDNFSREDQPARAEKLKEQYPDTLILDENERGRGRSASMERIWQRPKVREAVERIERGEVLELHGVGLDRLSRDEFFEDGAYLIRLCYEHHTKIVEPSHIYDFDDETDRLAAFLKFFVAGSKKGSDTAHQMRGMKRAAHNDELCPTYAMIGYKHDTIEHPRDPMRKKKVLVKDPHEGDLVHAIFDNYEDMSESALSRHLFERGYLKRVVAPRKSKNSPAYRPIKPADIRNVITNTIYMGIWGWGKQVRSALVAGYDWQPHYHPEWQWVSREQWERCNAVAKARRGKPWSASSRFAFTGLLRCVHNKEHRMQGRIREKGNEGLRYVCARRHKPPYDCPGQHVEQCLVRDALEAEVVDFLETKLPIRDLLHEAAAEYDEDPSGIKHLKLELFKNQQAMERLKDAVEQGIFTAEELRERKMRLQEQKARIEAQIRGAGQRQAIRAELKDAIALIQADLGGVVRRLDDKRFGKLTKLMYDWVQVEGYGHGKAGVGRRSRVVGYELRPELNELQLLTKTPCHPDPS